MAHQKSNTKLNLSADSSNEETQYTRHSLPPQATMPSVESPSLFTTDMNHVTFTFTFTQNAPNQHEEPITFFNHSRENDELLPTTTAQNGYGESMSASTVVYIDGKSVLSQKAQNGYDESFTPHAEPLIGITNQNENNGCPETHTALSEYNIVPTTITTQKNNDKPLLRTSYYDVDEGPSPTTAYPNNYTNLDLPSDSSVEHTEASTSHIAQNEYDKHPSLSVNEVKQIQSASLYTTSQDPTLEPKNSEPVIKPNSTEASTASSKREPDNDSPAIDPKSKILLLFHKSVCFLQ
jgi:hypothetical protein